MFLFIVMCPVKADKGTDGILYISVMSGQSSAGKKCSLHL